MNNRDFLKAGSWTGGQTEPSDQKKGVPMPDVFKAYQGYDLIDLPKVEDLNFQEKGFLDLVKDRRSRRQYMDGKMSQEVLSYLLFTNSGITDVRGKSFLRAYPSGGNRQTFETYLAIRSVEGLEAGIYRYIPQEHSLIFLKPVDNLATKLVDACLGQKWVNEACVSFIWTSLPYRGEWRYQERSHKVILLDAGHLCQNLYLACEALGNLGTCAIGAYDQDKMDHLIDVDGQDEYVIYLSPVGQVAE